MKTLETILAALSGPVLVQGSRDREVNAIRYDSRRVERGDVFVAVNARGDHGLEFLPAAIEAGAAIVVADAPGNLPTGLLDGDVTLVLVEDARRAMAEMAACLYDYPSRNLDVYGVTGTNGKTTTTYVLQQILEGSVGRVGVIGTLGKMLGEIVPTGYTTPEAPGLMEILDEMARAGLKAVAMEVSSHALALSRVAAIEFAGAVFTNLTQDHLDFHLTMQEYHDAKKLLFDGLDSGRPAVVNVDDLHGGGMVGDCHGTVYRFGRADVADARIRQVRLGPGGSSWQLMLSTRLGGGTLALESPLLGEFNVYNVTGAATLALAVGVPRTVIAERVASLRPVPGRMESIRLLGDATAVVDYAHTPDALENLLAACRQLLTAQGRIILVFGCGGDRDRTKRPQMGAVASRMADHVIVTSDNPRSELPDAIIDEILAGIGPDSAADRIVERREAIVAALESARDHDIVVVAGKGHETYQIVGDERRHFDDREVINAWVRQQWNESRRRTSAHGS